MSHTTTKIAYQPTITIRPAFSATWSQDDVSHTRNLQPTHRNLEVTSNLIYYLSLSNNALTISLPHPLPNKERGQLTHQIWHGLHRRRGSWLGRRCGFHSCPRWSFWRWTRPQGSSRSPQDDTCCQLEWGRECKKLQDVRRKQKYDVFSFWEPSILVLCCPIRIQLSGKNLSSEIWKKIF